MGSLGKEPRVGKKMDLSELQKSKCGRIEGEGDKKGYSRVNCCLVSTLVWLCLGPDQCCLFCLLN